MQSFSTCLWFDNQAESAAQFYVGLFQNSRILEVKHNLEGGPMPAGTLLTVLFSLNGSEYLALNGGPQYQHSPAMSLMVYCDTQDEVDTLWQGLCEGGQPIQCGWVTDKFGVSWQVVPRVFMTLLDSADKAASQRAMTAMMGMVKLDIAALLKAYTGA